jgi:hypothetical protein
MPPVKATLVKVLGRRRALEVIGGEVCGFATCKVEGFRFREGFVEGSIRHLNDGTEVFIVQLLIVEDSKMLPFAHLALVVELSSHMSMLVSTCTIMAKHLAYERGLKISFQITDDEKRSLYQLALPMLGDQEKNDQNCFMIRSNSSAGSSWKIQERVPISPTYCPAGGRPTNAQRNTPTLISRLTTLTSTNLSKTHLPVPDQNGKED